ncbi:hypothetical protein [Streptomyces sp. NPDC096030]|uniref:hypothetical protein n=1 Tax=Streptomyces sp. NPDC096030 TaxID=3155423 RepID=UPI003320EAD6
MSVRPVSTGHVLDCDHCPESLEDGDLVIVLATPAEIRQAGLDAGWTETAGQHTCTTSAHAPAA